MQLASAGTLHASTPVGSRYLIEEGTAWGMYAIVFRSDGFPTCRQVAGVSPDPVVTWNTQTAAAAFISAKGSDRDFRPVKLTDEAMDRIAATMGWPVESLTFDPCPG